MQTILVTGASGLVGSRLLPRLAHAGYECRALVRGDLPLSAGVTGIRGDLLDAASLRQAVEGVDAVVHLAALFRTGNEADIWRTNLDGTRSLLEAVAAHAPRARFIMTSTGNVYDAEASRPGREDDVPTPTAAYPASKLAAEALVRESGLTWCVLRLPFVYGDGDGHLESMSALVPRFGLHPAHTYSVIHHRDVATAVGLALSGVMDGRIVNVCDDAPMTVLEMVELGGGQLESSAEPLTNPWSGRMDATLAGELGFRPTVPTIRAAARDGLL
jgi:UDP-glucose 4-epimerase